MFYRPLRILVAESNAIYARAVCSQLRGLGYEVVWARTARETMDRIYERLYDLIVIATDLQDLDGRHLCSELKNDLVFRHIPIVLIHREFLPSEELDARESGADDYLTIPVDVQELHGRIQQILRRGTIGVNLNPITGLPGYNQVIHRIKETLADDRPFAVCLMDLNGLKHFNHRYGYERGDEVLRMTARVVTRVLRSFGRDLDFLGHIGADDFVLITSPEGVGDLCSGIIADFDKEVPTLYEPLDLERGFLTTYGRRGEEIRAGILFLSIAIITDQARPLHHVATILEQGASLLSYAKAFGKSRWVMERRKQAGPLAAYSWRHKQRVAPIESPRPPEGKERPHATGVDERVAHFREIIRTRDLKIFLQPIVSLETNEIYGYEALLRGPAGTYFESPVTLFSMARQEEMVLELDLLSYQKVLECLEAIPSPLKLFFNVTPESFYNPMFREILLDAHTSFQPCRTVLEITRKRRILDYKAFRDAAEYFKQRGFQLAVDDAQSGTVSLHTILALTPDFIKVDMSVVRGITSDWEKQRIFLQFINCSKKQGAQLVPEGVESASEKDFIARHGARLAQGFFFAPPRPLPPPARAPSPSS